MGQRLKIKRSSGNDYGKGIAWGPLFPFLALLLQGPSPAANILALDQERYDDTSP